MTRNSAVAEIQDDRAQGKRGRKAASQSRAEEIRTKLLAWRQTPEPQRISLQALAVELGTSHQLLLYYLDGLEKWKLDRNYRNAKRRIGQIRARAEAENRELTPSESEQVSGWDRESIRLLAAGMLLKQIEKIRNDAREHGGLDHWQIKMLKICARQRLPGAEELLRKYPRPRVVERPQQDPFERQRKISRLISRLEAIGGVLLFEEGEVRYFVPNYDANASALLTQLQQNYGEVRHFIERYTKRLIELGKYDAIKAEICRLIPADQLKPLESLDT